MVSRYARVSRFPATGFDLNFQSRFGVVQPLRGLVADPALNQHLADLFLDLGALWRRLIAFRTRLYPSRPAAGLDSPLPSHCL